MEVEKFSGKDGLAPLEKLARMPMKLGTILVFLLKGVMNPLAKELLRHCDV